DVGVDVPSVGAVILAGGGKAEVEMRQRVGRGLRAKKNQANVCFISDFIDISYKHLMSHSYERKHIIDTTPWFAEGVLPVGSSF
ncbi:ATP-dependent helicase, partial [Klebsiella pneumoniae]